MEMINVADTDDHVTYEAIQDVTETQQQTIDVDINVVYAGLVLQNERCRKVSNKANNWILQLQR